MNFFALCLLSQAASAAAFMEAPASFRPKTSLSSFQQAPYQPGYAGPGGYDMQRTEMTAPMATTTEEIFSQLDIVPVQGGSLRTCTFSEYVDRVQVFLKTTGRPLNANVELWQGPDNCPQRMQVYLEDGNIRPLRATLLSPGSSNSVAIRNTGQLEFPISAAVQADTDGSIDPMQSLANSGPPRTVQGGAVYTTPFSPAVQSVQVMLRTDGRPLNARVELLQGPNNNKQVMEVYSEDGDLRPLYAIIDTPGVGNVVRIVNTATVEFPLFASLEPYVVDDTMMAMDGPDLSWS